METIYSKIIWGELGLSEYEIHLEPEEKTQQLVLDWVRNAPLNRVNELLDKAKEMEKHQHYDTFIQGLKSNFQTFEKYYNETYGDNNLKL